MELDNILSLYRLDAVQFFGYRLGTAAKLYDRCVARIIGQHSINISQWRVIALLRVRPGVTVRILAEGVAADRSESSRSVRGLTELGLVARQENTRDSRSPTFSLTEAGHALHSSVQPALEALIIDLLSGSQHDDIETSAQLLRHLTMKAASVLG